jgi:hypothetical protein
VNYEGDTQWFSWHQDAMRRFLLSAPPTAGMVDLWLPAEPIKQVAAEPFTTEGTEDLWWPQRQSPVGEGKTNFEGLNTLFGACSQVVALEGEPWDLSPVSTATPLSGLKMLSTQNLTNRIVQYSPWRVMTSLIQIPGTR